MARIENSRALGHKGSYTMARIENPTSCENLCYFNNLISLVFSFNYCLLTRFRDGKD